jgi:signal transduction histidine kinase
VICAARVREQERQRLGRDLHDGVGPSLAALALALENARQMVHVDPDGVESLLAHAADHARATVGDVRRIIHALRPPSLESLGLVAAVNEQAHRLGVSGLQVTVHASGDLRALPSALESAVHWIVCEALGNVIRHSGARHAVVLLERSQDGMTVRISDDGSGMDPRARRGVGIASMHERARELGGRLAIATRCGGGTEITARLPLEMSGGAHAASSRRRAR